MRASMLALVGAFASASTLAQAQTATAGAVCTCCQPGAGRASR